ncbi:right-handed parallel beta-helix repeat-containing protein [Salmonella enterica subsp. enterica]|nr:right-handed parallel beta-helix repeat-containing protein [Salmonella enterica subsp. enterica serovar Kentucky]
MFAQGGSGSVGIKTNKQAIARHFGVKQSEVIYCEVGKDIAGYKVIYDKVSQRSYSLPTTLPVGTVIVSFADGVLTLTGGVVDLGALAVTREEFVTLPGSFTSGATLTVKNELLVYLDSKYRWGGEFPKTIPANSTPASTGGVSDSAWILQTDPYLRSDLNTATAGKGADLVKFKTGTAVQSLVDPDGFNVIGKFAQVADLRSVAASAGTTVLVKEHTTGRGALGGGQFVAVASTIDDDDGVYISSGTAGVTWVRKDAGSHVKIEWFGGKSEDSSIDHSPILANAQKSEGRSIEFQYGSYYYTPPCIIKPGMHFIGSGGAKTFWRNKNINADAGVFYANTGSISGWAENAIFERIHFSNDIPTIPTQAMLAMTHVGNFKFNNCGFYNAPIYGSDLHFVTWNGCTFINSLTTINEDVVSPTFPINEMPSFIDCYMVRSPINITDTADLHLVNSVMFYGPYGIKSTAHRSLDAGATTNGFPIMITNSTIDNIDGYCLDLNRVAIGTITNSFFSGGRVSNTPAIKATEILGLSFNGNVIHFAGQECMYLYDTENVLMGNNQFSSCNGFAIKAQYSRNNVLNGNFFGTQKVSGGWNTCTGGVNFDTNDNLAWQITGNVFAGGIPGVAGQVGTGRTVYRATANAGLADN